MTFHSVLIISGRYAQTSGRSAFQEDGILKMKLLSVNVGKEQRILHAKPSGKTGIFKVPQTGPVMIAALGLQGDAIVDTKNHGGPDQAVYIYTMPDYEWWSSHIERPFPPGTFGENLTITDLESATLNVGDRLRVGKVLLEITAPRLPCVTIAARMEDPQFVKKFRHAEKPGAYCRVIEPGYVEANDPIELILYEGVPVSIREFFRALISRELTPSDLQRLLNVPIGARDRAHLEGLLGN